MIDSTPQLEYSPSAWPMKPLTPPADDDHDSLPPGWWLVLVIPFAFCDFLMVPILSAFKGPPTAILAACGFAVVGCTLAQGTLLAAWLVWSVGPFPRRLALHWATAAALYGCWFVGAALSVRSNDDFIKITVPIALAVPVISMAAQLPLWVVRHSFGWHLVRPGGESDVTAVSPLTIRDLLLATLLVAVSFGLVRLAPGAQSDKEFWAVIGVAITVAMSISTIAMLPAGAFLLRMRRFNVGLLFSGLYVGLFVTTLWLIVIILYWREPRFLPPLALCVGLTSLMLSFAATLVVTASAVRAKGYRLVWGRRRLSR
jgi:hypothetical protein